MKNSYGFFSAIIITAIVGLSCSIFEDKFDEFSSVEQSGEMICIVKKRQAYEVKVRRPITKGELFLYGRPFTSEEFPAIVVRNCSALSKEIMYVSGDGGSFLWTYIDGDYKLKRLSLEGTPSNNLPWFVSETKRKNELTGEEIPFKAKLPSNFIGNSPDWKTIITEGQNLVDEDLVTLFVVDVETGVAKKRFVRRQNYKFLLDSTNGSAWIGSHFGWVPDATGKYQLVYPVFEPEETKK